MKRIYQFKNIKLRDIVDLKAYETVIKTAFGIRKDIRVKVYQDRYEVYGDITNGELRKIGRRICANPELGRLCKRYKTSTQLFVRVKDDCNAKCRNDVNEAYNLTFLCKPD